MCGIVGVLSSGHFNTSIEAMVNAMNHRGPDGFGFYSENNISLGHARLSILDLSNFGAQPMYSENGNLVMVFNGEVFNYKQLAKEYLKGVHLKSGSDSEVVLKLFEKFGEKCLELFRGMFAILIWNKEQQELFGARDRLGIKPLYYSQSSSTLVFGSEIKAILASDIVSNEIDNHSIFQLFQYGHIGQPNSIIKAIKAVPPASWFKVRINEQLVFNTYWTFGDHEVFSGSFEDASARFRDEFEEAVSLRMISDRPIGVFLSSGLDSVSLLAALKNRNFNNVNTYSIGFEYLHDKFYREDLKAKEIAEHFGYHNESIVINTEDAINDFPSFAFGLDQPSIDGFNSFLISKYTKSHITVALSGLGGDELFLGYPRNLYLYNRIKKGNYWFNALNEKCQLSLQNGRLSKSKYLLGFLNKYAGYNDFNKGFWLHHTLANYSQTINKFKFSHELLIEDELNRYISFANNSGAKCSFNKITAYEFRTYTLNQLLRDMDTVSMFNSMEVRVPFLDHKFIEFCLSLPDDYKYRPEAKGQNFGTGKTTYARSGMKYILGKSYEGLFPKDYLNSPKQGFQLPIYDWAYSYCKSIEYDFLSDSVIQDLFNNNFIKAKRSYLFQAKKFDNDLFLMFILALWMRNRRY